MVLQGVFLSKVNEVGPSFKAGLRPGDKLLMVIMDFYPALDTSGTGYCFLSISLFLCLFIAFFVSLSARLRENGWTDLHEIFREGVE